MPSFEQITTSFIDQASCASDLLKVLQCIPLERIKEFVHNEMKTKNAEEIRSICVRSCPMDDIISNDVLQTVLSFVPHQSSNKMVNQTFKTLATRNQVIIIELK